MISFDLTKRQVPLFSLYRKIQSELHLRRKHEAVSLKIFIHQCFEAFLSIRRKTFSSLLLIISALSEEYNNLDSFVVVQELELAMNLVVYGLL